MTDSRRPLDHVQATGSRLQAVGQVRLAEAHAAARSCCRLSGVAALSGYAASFHRQPRQTVGDLDVPDEPDGAEQPAA